MLDFCYFATYFSILACALCIIRITFGASNVLAPYNYIIIRGFFALVNGPLAWSILIFRNSLVFHDIDRTTSTFIHLSPALMSWCIRWGAGKGPSVVRNAWRDATTSHPMFDVCPGGLMETAAGRETADACIGKLWCDVCGAGWKEFIVPGLVMWFCWAAFYYIVVLVLLRAWTVANKKETLYDEVTKTNPVIRGFVNLFPHSLKGMAYLFTHGATTVLFGAIGVIFWHSFWVHTLFLVAMMFMAVYVLSESVERLMNRTRSY